MRLIFTSFLFYFIFPQNVKAQWDSNVSDFGFDVQDATFVSSSKLFTVLSNNTSLSSKLNFSTDGGKTFTVIGGEKKNIDYYSLRFFDDKNGLISGFDENTKSSYVWKTSDGGITLKPIVLEKYVGQDVPRPKQMYFLNNSVGFISTTSFSGSTFYKTIDGGSSWIQIGGVDFVYTNQLQYFSEKIALRLIARNAQFSFEKSTDGLLSWKKVNFPSNPVSFYFNDEQNGYFGTSDGEIYKTTNGGSSWSLSAKMPFASIKKIKFINPLVGFAAVNAYQTCYLLRTIDGGNSWQTTYISPNQNALIDNVFLFNENIGFAPGFLYNAFTSNAATAPNSKRPTVYVSSNDTSCDKTHFKIRLNLTGTAPWTVKLAQTESLFREIKVNQSPADIDFFTFPPYYSYGGVSALSVSDAEGVSKETGGIANAVLIQPTLELLNPEAAKVCFKSLFKLNFKLTGCSPWSLSIKDDERDTIITDITDPNYFYTSPLKNIGGNEIYVQGVKSGEGDWVYYDHYDDTKRKRVDRLYDPTNTQVRFSGDTIQRFCNKNGFFNLTVDFVQTPLTTNVSISNGTNTYSKTNLDRSDFLSFQIPANQIGKWKIISASDGCGDVKITGTPIQVQVFELPPAISNIKATFINNGENLLFSWNDNSDTNVLVILKRLLNPKDQYYSGDYTHSIPSGVQKFSAYSSDIFLTASDTVSFAFYTVNKKSGCTSKSDTVTTLSNQKISKRNHYSSPPNSGVVLADLNNDKLPDMLIVGGCYINKGNFNFEYHTQDFGGQPTVVGDLNNDGLLDFLVNDDIGGQTKIYLNNGNFNFTLLQTVKGIRATFFDYDFNGLLDIAAADHSYKNIGDGRYIEISGLDYYFTKNISGTPYYFDFNGDGLVDLYDIGNYNGDYFSLSNAYCSPDNFKWYGSGPLEPDYTSKTGKPLCFNLIDGYNKGFEEPVIFFGEVLSEQVIFGRAAKPVEYFYREEESSRYVSVISSNDHNTLGDLKGHGQGVTLDIDNDGVTELFDGNALEYGLQMDGQGFKYGYFYPPYGIFDFNGSPISYGAPASADLNNDGKLDIVVALPDGGIDVFENAITNGNNWLKVKVNSSSRNKSALGDIVRIYYKNAAGKSFKHACSVGGVQGGKSRSDIIPHFGVGKATIIDSVVVRWNETSVTKLTNVAVNQFLSIDEPIVHIRPDYPVQLRVEIAPNNQLKLSWKDMAQNEKGFIVQRSTTSWDTGFITLDTLAPNTTTYYTPLIQGISGSTAYYRIFSFNRLANSAFSNIASLGLNASCELMTGVDSVYISPEKSFTACSGQIELRVPSLQNASYQWLINDSPILNAKSNSFFADNSGRFGLKITNSSGCVRSLAAVEVNFLQNLQAKIAPDSAKYICNGSSKRKLIASPLNVGLFNYSFQYQFTDQADPYWGEVSTSNSINADKSGYYRVVVKSKDASCYSISDSVYVNLDSVLKIVFDSDHQFAISCGEPQTLHNRTPTTPNLSFSWYRDDTLISKDSTIIISKLSQSGNYKLVAIDTFTGCASESNIQAVSFSDNTLKNFKLDSINCSGNLGFIKFDRLPYYELNLVKGDIQNGSGSSVEIDYINGNKLNSGNYALLIESSDISSADCSKNIYFRIKDGEKVIKGFVKLPDGKPSSYSEVRLLKLIPPRSYEQTSGRTDANGNYSFTLSDFGNYKILAISNDRGNYLDTYFGDQITFDGSKTIDILDCVEKKGDIVLKSLKNTSVSNIDSNIQFSVSPNPFDDVISVKVMANSELDGIIEMFDSKGSLAKNWNKKIIRGENVFNIETNLSSGMYYLRIKTENGVSSALKIIK